jgi:glycerol-3-phosphate acyltransferase PlsY
MRFDVTVFWLILSALIGYLIGGIPFGKILVWQVKKIDIQKIGSKNIGSTNVYRAAGLKLALVVFTLDFLKGFIPVLVSWLIFKNSTISLITGYFTVLGNVFSPYLKFKGGKGVATSTGICFFFFHILVVIAFVFALVILKLAKKMSIATFCGLAMCTFLVVAIRSQEYQIFMILVAATIIYTHRENIKRLINGQELSLDKS